MPISAALKLP